jgi:hypothetical protein
MNTLKLEHLAPYLPYQLKIECNSQEEIKQNGNYISEMIELGIKSITDNYGNNWNFNIKPILRPLSDLTKEIEVNGVRFVPIDYNAFKNDKYHLTEFINGFAHYKSVKYGIIERLLEWHFDIFNLIPQKLAIDFNTLEL